jgi:hypothetical protein
MRPPRPLGGSHNNAAELKIPISTFYAHPHQSAFVLRKSAALLADAFHILSRLRVHANNISLVYEERS